MIGHISWPVIGHNSRLVIGHISWPVIGHNSRLMIGHISWPVIGHNRWPISDEQCNFDPLLFCCKIKRRAQRHNGIRQIKQGWIETPLRQPLVCEAKGTEKWFSLLGMFMPTQTVFFFKNHQPIVFSF